MCGIAGLYNTPSPEALQPMLQAISSRGPDDGDILVEWENGICLGHKRLSIIDLSAGGRQPMTDASGRFSITYNGEIYNHLELRRELQELGHSFRTRTDTEVVLSAYRHWGQDCLRRLRGMFALAILDRGPDYGGSWLGGQKVPDSPYLFLARDRFGIKPLVYTQTGRGFAFASELKALLASGLVQRTVRPEAVVEYLSYGAVSQPGTILKGVYQLEPGTAVYVSQDGFVSTPSRYWDLSWGMEANRDALETLAYPDLVQKTRSLLEEATQNHLVSDVPVGAFLSGGVDSAAVCALMQRETGEPVQTFSLGFKGLVEVTDETSFAKEVAKYIGCQHTEVLVNDRDVAECFDDIISALDQPSVDGTNTYLVSQAAAQQVKVAVSGLGGDELFAGYHHFAAFKEAARGEAGPVDYIASMLHKARPNRFTVRRAYKAASFEQRLAMMRNLTVPNKLRGQLSGSLAALCGPYTHPALLGSDLSDWDAVSQLSYAECKGYLQNTLLRDNDVMSMAHSLEVRPVLLDHKLAEHALALPAEAKICNGQMKAVLVDAVSDLIPPGCWQRPKKGFELPFATWMNGRLRPRVRDAFFSSEAKEIFDRSYLDRMKNRINKGSIPRSAWAPFVLLSWIKHTSCRL
ncbi:asparagine synthase (glutamine-hydrolyzing) [Spiribacter pallidus]|uniref:asparagine synthase (glutamine-hydrolyzing) n=1 Tax=Spiribacter pallidus TaxID=1987936 RepID=A0ABV3TCM7_9GAMM